MITKSRKKSQKKYACIPCDYTSSNKYDLKKHFKTMKHRMITNDNTVVTESRKIVCGVCGKKYKYRSGLSRHKKTCNNNVTIESGVLHTVKKLIEENEKKNDLLEKIVDQNQKLIPMVGNNNNNKISINVFLNKHCKDAMNISDFMDSINVSIEDLNYTNEYGYAKGISNIFVKHLTDMKITERPIHCSDKKRLQFYIKDEDKWGKDDSHEKINKTIQDITIKQIKRVREWETKHPNYMKDSALQEEWLNMIREIMGGSEIGEREKNNETIKKEISDTVSVKDAISN